MPLDENNEYFCDHTLKRVAVDFDGVLYPGGHFENEYSFTQEALPGSIEWLMNMVHGGYEVLILTARMCSEPHTKYLNGLPKADVAALIRAWLATNGVPQKLLYGRLAEVIVYPTKHGKPSVDLFIDDHAIRYSGGQYPDPSTLNPWWANEKDD